MRVALGIVLSVLVGAEGVAGSVIYRCELDRGIIYSDRPCAADARTHRLDDSRVTVYEAPAAAERTASPVTRKPPPKRPKADRQGTTQHEQRQARCAKLTKSLRDVRTKMRTGYGVEEGERLKERHRQLTADRRGEKCS